MPEAKQKLTLTVDSDTVEAAKKLGLNISEETERLLQSYTFDPEGTDRATTNTEYCELLSRTDRLVSKYGLVFCVGSYDGWDGEELHPGGPVFYHGAGQFSSVPEVTSMHALQTLEEFEDTEETQGIQTSVKFFRPTQILKNFFAAVDEAKRARREEVEGLAFARTLIDALNVRESKQAAAGQETGRKRK